MSSDRRLPVAIFLYAGAIILALLAGVFLLPTPAPLDTYPTAVHAHESRSPQWPKVRAAHLKAEPHCAFCKLPAEEVHHIIPYHEQPALELVDDNLISLCHHCHFMWGHLCNFDHSNPRVREDARAFRKRVEAAKSP